jgi:hypothetical protein
MDKIVSQEEFVTAHQIAAAEVSEEMARETIPAPDSTQARLARAFRFLAPRCDPVGGLSHWSVKPAFTFRGQAALTCPKGANQAHV